MDRVEEGIRLQNIRRAGKGVRMGSAWRIPFALSV